MKNVQNPTEITYRFCHLVDDRPLSNDARTFSRQAQPGRGLWFATQAPHVLSKWIKDNRITNTNYRFHNVLVPSSFTVFDFKSKQKKEDDSSKSLLTARIVDWRGQLQHEEFCEPLDEALGIRSCKNNTEFDVKLEASLHFYEEMEPKITVIVCIIKMIDFLPQYLEEIQVNKWFFLHGNECLSSPKISSLFSP